MTNLRDQIRERSRMALMRSGNAVGEPVEIPSMPEIRAALVPLTEAEILSGLAAAAAIDIVDNAAGLQVRDRTAQLHDVWQALREPNDLSAKVFSSVEDMTGEEGITSDDVDILSDRLNQLHLRVSPSLADMSDEAVEMTKKVLQRIEPRELTGRQAGALLHFVSVLTQTSHQVSFLSSTSIPSSTMRNENDEST